MSLVSLRGISVALGDRWVLRDVDLRIDAGEIVTVVGPNGSGKSTLLRTITGAVQPSVGKLVRAHDLTLGYVPQRLNLDSTLPLSVGRFLQLPVRHPSASVQTVLNEVGLGDSRARQLAALSGGETQRVLLARALLNQPQLLLLDEPTQGLDQLGESTFYQLVASLRAAYECAVVMVSHDLRVVMSASDRVVCLNGHICCEGTPEAVASTPQYRALFGEDTQGALALYRHAHERPLAAQEAAAAASDVA